MEKKPIRVVVAKPGLDGHDRGAKVVAQALRDAGMEVIYTGLRQTPAQIVEVAIQEDAQVVALSSLSGAHSALFPQVVEGLRAQGLKDVLVLGGGVIPDDDIPFLKEAGVAEIFTPGTDTRDIVAYIEEHFYGPKKKPEILHIDHVGIAVKDLKAAIAFYENVIGIKCTAIEEVPEQKVRVAFLPSGDAEVELLESTDPEGPIAKFIAKNGEGIQHVAYRVDDLEAKLEELKKAGVPLIDQKPRRGAGGADIAFLHPKGTFGHLVELCQRPGKLK
ncbi:methymalonyl-coa mutase c-terminal domain protein [Heliomicrobium modesticaldum Ice1]|uniref:Methymalonyl-coa mutase c-terminal domain protein n=1 Tax=Heliobacterium modesticaldum (strain ATCC 51547 / Ice1) TaxID=498761 RepID=B0TF13_HELMI|nr:methymalonyl-coa mutase c-terminal domain protein [Heliomicrobium modesticaldum Ice1]